MIENEDDDCIYNFFINLKEKFGRFEILFLVIYSIEMFLKIVGLGKKFYYYNF